MATATIQVVQPSSCPDTVPPADSGVPDITWVRHERDAANDEEREELKRMWPPEWTGEEAGDVTDSAESLVFRLNESFPDLRKAITRRADSASGSKDAVESLKDCYAGAVSYGMFLLNDAKGKVWPRRSRRTSGCDTPSLRSGRMQIATMFDAELDAEDG